MASGEPAFAPPTSSSVVPCPLAAGPTFIAIVEGASRPSAEPFVPPGDAGGPTFSQAERPRVLSPDAPSPGSATSPSTSSGPTPETSSSPCEVLRPAKSPREEASAAEGASPLAEPFVPPEDARGPTSPPVKGPRGRLPDAPSPGSATSPSTTSGPIPVTSSFPGVLLRSAGRPRKASGAEGAPEPSAERPVGFDAGSKSSASAEGPR